MEQRADIDASSLAEPAGKLRRRVRVAEIEYKAVTPVMVGDYGGMHYRILAQTGENSANPKLWITGLPTAKAIIGKARWFSRVLLASAFNLKTHRDAEEKILIKFNNIKLSLLKAFFGGKSVKGTVTVRLEYESFATLPLNWVENINNINIKEYNKLRKTISPDKFYITSNSGSDFFEINLEEGYIPYSPNRFNVFLANRNKIYEIKYNNIAERDARYFSIVPLTRQDTIAHVEPLASEIIKFKLIVEVNYKRLKKLIRYNREDEEPLKQLIGWATVVTASVPVILGLGKASAKGFGHFKINDIIELNDQFIDESSQKVLREDLRNIYISNENNYFINIINLTENLKNNMLLNIDERIDRGLTLIPIIDIRNSVLTTQKIRSSGRTYRNDLEVINAIADASHHRRYTPYRGDKHMWFLGLPRLPVGIRPRGISRVPRGYRLNYGKYKRRQSMVFSLPISKDGLRVLSILLYSDDLFRVRKHIWHRRRQISSYINSLDDYKDIIINRFNKFASLL